MKNKIIKYAAIDAVLTALYVIAIASFLFYAPKFLGTAKANNTVLVPIVLLSLLVFSAALVGSLIFGRPALWYLDGKKGESISLLAYTLGFFLIITIAALFVLYFVA